MAMHDYNSSDPVCSALNESDIDPLNIQKPGWVSEPCRTVSTFFFELEQSVHDLANEIDLERLTDAALKAACADRATFRFNPVEWDEPDTGRMYRFTLTLVGPHKERGLTGKLFAVNLVTKHAKAKGGR